VASTRAVVVEDDPNIVDLIRSNLAIRGYDTVVSADETAEVEKAAEIALVSAPEVLAGSLGEYTRIWLRRVRSGESGALPVIVGLIIIGGYFQARSSAFLSAGNIANLMGRPPPEARPGPPGTRPRSGRNTRRGTLVQRT
jgi:hypothetical protein